MQGVWRPPELVVTCRLSALFLELDTAGACSFRDAGMKSAALTVVIDVAGSLGSLFSPPLG